MEQTSRKISVRIWTPLLEKFTQQMDEACLRRDAWLAKVLTRELEELEAAGNAPLSLSEHIPERERVNSEAARQYIAARLDALPRKLVTLTLPEGLMHRLDDICARKRIVRDSFFNRLLFLMVAHDEHIARLFFDDDHSWKHVLIQQRGFASKAAEHFAQRIPEFRDPLCAVRAACSIAEWHNPDDPSQSEVNEWDGPDGIYTVPITADTFPGIDLSGLNVYLADDHLPAATKDTPAISLDDLLKSSATKSNSHHSSQQMQRRGLSPVAITWLLFYGSITHDHRGAEIYHFDKSSLRRLERDWGPTVARRLDSLRGSYAVSATDGTLITVGHRYTRIRRDRSRRDRWPSRRAHRLPWPAWTGSVAA